MLAWLILGAHNPNCHLPYDVSYKEWGERRYFDPLQAEQEKVWHKSGGGLTDTDRRILGAIYYESDSVYESGIGESTSIAVFTRVPRYTGVDSSIQWLKQIMEISPAHYRFHWADLGTIKEWGHPVSTITMPKWSFASTAALAAEKQAFDFYFIDGRFRVASFAVAFLHASTFGKKADQFRVGIHDSQRSGYDDCLKIAVPVDGFKAGVAGAHITIYRRKPNITDWEILAVWKRHKHSPL